MSIRENWMRLRESVEDLALHYGRDAGKLVIMAVSKNRSAAEVLEAAEAGVTLFGENRVMEAVEKFAGIPDRLSLHLIGRLQSNKISKFSVRFCGVQSIDSEKSALKLSRHREASAVPLEVLLQVNTSGEESKSGFTDRGEFKEAAASIARMPALRLRGVMTIAPFVDDERTVRSCFASCRRWSEDLIPLLEDAPQVSMGMSSDYPWAIAEGSTMLRMGGAVFER